LAHFIAVVDERAMGDAARKLGMSQGALSKSIQALERSLGAPLFTRSKRGMALNQFGQAIEVRARLILAESGRARNSIRELLGVQRGKVAIASTALFSGAILPRAITRFRETHPGIDLYVQAAYVDGPFNAVSHGSVDFTLTSLHARPLAPNLTSEVLLPKVPVSIVASGDNPITRRRNVTVEELAHCPWILPAYPSFFGAAFNELFARHRLPAPQPAIECESIPLTHRLLREGPFVGMTSETLLADELKSGAIRRVDLGPRFKIELDAGAVWRKDEPLMPAADALLKCIREVCAEIRRAELVRVGVRRSGRA